MNHGQHAFSAGAGGYQPAGADPCLPTMPQQPPPSDAEALWQRAQQAERAGNVSEAIQLYSQLASQTTGNNQELAMQGLNRAYWLREAAAQHRRLDHAAGAGPIRCQETTASEVRYGSGPRGTLQLSAMHSASRWANQRRSGNAGGALASRHAGGLPLQRPGSSAAGRTSPGEPQNLCAGVEPELSQPLRHSATRASIWNRFSITTWSCIGPAIYRGDLRANYMTVVRVQPLP